MTIHPETKAQYRCDLIHRIKELTALRPKLEAAMDFSAPDWEKRRTALNDCISELVTKKRILMNIDSKEPSHGEYLGIQHNVNLTGGRK
jgi:hypothetical protein